jgi:hypothetical protein
VRADLVAVARELAQLREVHQPLPVGPRRAGRRFGERLLEPRARAFGERLREADDRVRERRRAPLRPECAEARRVAVVVRSGARRVRRRVGEPVVPEELAALRVLRDGEERGAHLVAREQRPRELEVVAHAVVEGDREQGLAVPSPRRRRGRHRLVQRQALERRGERGEELVEEARRHREVGQRIRRTPLRRQHPMQRDDREPSGERARRLRHSERVGGRGERAAGEAAHAAARRGTCLLGRTHRRGAVSSGGAGRSGSGSRRRGARPRS